MKLLLTKKFWWDKYLGGVRKWNNHLKSNLYHICSRIQGLILCYGVQKIQAVYMYRGKPYFQEEWFLKSFVQYWTSSEFLGSIEKKSCKGTEGLKELLSAVFNLMLKWLPWKGMLITGAMPRRRVTNWEGFKKERMI